MYFPPFRDRPKPNFLLCANTEYSAETQLFCKEQNSRIQNSTYPIVQICHYSVLAEYSVRYSPEYFGRNRTLVVFMSPVRQFRGREGERERRNTQSRRRMPKMGKRSNWVQVHFRRRKGRKRDFDFSISLPNPKEQISRRRHQRAASTTATKLGGAGDRFGDY